MERRLTTILSAGVVDYSRLMEQDEAGTLAEVMERQSGIIEPLNKQTGGRLIKAPGDAFLIEFRSVVNAVTFAVNLQQACEARNANLPEDRRMSFRVGINLWDMIVEPSDVFDEGVNVAIRLQAIAEPGSILISETVYQHVHRHLTLTLENAGNRQLTHGPALIPTYRVLPQGELRIANALQTSLAVLPFANLSGDPEQNYLSDGITEGIISSLSKISTLFVVARDMAFNHKGTTETLSQLAMKLGVQYIIQGSVKRNDNSVRVTVQLMDGHTHGHLWAERYDCSFDAVFTLQTDISRDIVHALHLKMLPAEEETLNQRFVHSSEAYRFYLMGRSYFHRGHTRRFLRLAKQMFQRALEIEPNYAAAHAGIADCNSHLIDTGDTSVSADDVLQESQRALAIDSTLAEAHASKGLGLYTAGLYWEAETSFERAIALKPDLFEAYYFYGRNAFNLGQFDKAADLFGRASKLKSDDFRSLGLQSMCYHSLSQFSEARAAARSALARVERAVADRPDEADPLSFGAGLLAYLGEHNRTKDWAQRALIIEPDDFYMHYNIACAFAVLGENELALDELEQIMTPQVMISRQEYMLRDSDLDGLRQHPRYLGILKRLGY